MNCSKNNIVSNVHRFVYYLLMSIVKKLKCIIIFIMLAVLSQMI